ncbi:MAG: thioredoxin [Spirochaetes bacterium]|nr:thioredoxin [Spirochaetota bacterium]
MSKEVIVTDDNFENEVLKSTKPVLVDFWAAWCGPCRMLGPIVEEIANEYSDKVKVCKVNVDDNRNISAKYNIMSIPTVIIFKNGQIVEQTVGVAPKEKLVGLFQKHI